MKRSHLNTEINFHDIFKSFPKNSMRGAECYQCNGLQKEMAIFFHSKIDRVPRIGTNGTIKVEIEFNCTQHTKKSTFNRSRQE